MTCEGSVVSMTTYDWDGRKAASGSAFGMELALWRDNSEGLEALDFVRFEGILKEMKSTQKADRNDLGSSSWENLKVKEKWKMKKK